MAVDNVEVLADDIAPEVEVEAPAEVEVEAEPEQTAEAAPAPDIAALISGLTEDEIASLPAVNGILQRRTQSARDKAASETTTKMFAQEREFVASGEAERALLALAEAAAENIDERGRAKADPREVKRLTAALLSHGSNAAVGQLSNVIAGEIGDGFELTQAESDSIELAKQKYMQNPLDPTGLQRAWLAPLRRAWATQEREVGRAEGRAEAKREQEAAAKAAKAKQAADTRNGSPGITSVNGAPIAGAMTLEEIDKEPMSQWMSRPPEERTRLIAQAERLAHAR